MLSNHLKVKAKVTVETSSMPNTLQINNNAQVVIGKQEIKKSKAIPVTGREGP
jgi:hypothetical protein